MKYILKTIFLLFAISQTLQAGRYYDNDYGRFVSRDPLGYTDGMSLYNGYFAEGFGMDPSGKKFTPFVVKIPLDQILKNYGHYGVTIEIPPFLVREDEFTQDGKCCVDLTKSAEFQLIGISLVPSTNTVNGVEEISENAISSINSHEMRRLNYMKSGHDEYLNEGFKGYACASSTNKAEELLKEELNKQRKIAVEEYLTYVSKERKKVDDENFIFTGHIKSIEINPDPYPLEKFKIIPQKPNIPDYYDPKSIQSTGIPPKTNVNHDIHIIE